MGGVGGQRAGYPGARLCQTVPQWQQFIELSSWRDSPKASLGPHPQVSRVEVFLAALALLKGGEAWQGRRAGWDRRLPGMPAMVMLHGRKHCHAARTWCADVHACR